MASDQPPETPPVRIHGPATAEDVAAVLAVLAAASAGPEEPADVPGSAWASRSAAVGGPPRPGPRAWRDSLRR